MTEHEATRTLVKSPPELWAECSDAGSLSRHLAESFGEIRITRLEPETAVAWEGERISGTVRIEPSAWGTRVTLTAQMEAVEEPAVVEETVVEAEPVAVEETADPSDPPPAAAVRRGFMARMRSLFRPIRPADAAAVAPPEPSGIEAPPEPLATEAQAPAEAEQEPVAVEAMTDPEPEPAIAVPEPAPELEASSAPEPAIDPEAVLSAALDSLGQAHHRPFSRA